MSSEALDGPALLQLSVLASLVGDDPMVIREFLADFRASAQSLSSEIANAHSAGNLAQVGALAHRLKSSARSVGALPLGDICAELEKAGKQGNATLAESALQRFTAMLAKVDAELVTHLAHS